MLIKLIHTYIFAILIPIFIFVYFFTFIPEILSVHYNASTWPRHLVLNHVCTDSK